MSQSIIEAAAKPKPNYLNFYQEWAAKPRAHFGGLCEYFHESDPIFNLIKPTYEDKISLARDRIILFWGRDNGEPHCKFTPLRQTIVLFMAAMNNEL